MVYFLAAKVLRDEGAGPTLIVSPLLALMRNQIDAARRLGLRPETINSSNAEQWGQVKRALLADEVDLLLISPERLANDGFVEDVLLPIAERIGLLVVDEAHCISDWGHDFRPDYRRIVRVLRQLPRNVPVLATTATANSRVVADVEAQLGPNIETLRGPLTRESLSLQTYRMPDAAVRLGWLAEHLRELPGSGIVYTLTVRDAERVAEWLDGRGISARAYHSDTEDRERLEQDLVANRLKCLVATTALGMGFDKPDLGFVVHFQTPGSVVHYYQQVGRAGRAIPEAFGILMAGEEDDDINAFFRDTAFPPEAHVQSILEALEAAENGLDIRGIEEAVNLRYGQIDKVLKILSVEDSSPVTRDRNRWFRTPNAWRIDRARIEHLTRQREEEWRQMQAYVSGRSCLMRFLANALDDPMDRDCGKCAVCLGRALVSPEVRPQTLQAAQRFMRRSEMVLEPKKQWPAGAFPRYGWRGTRIPENLLAAPGRVLARWRETGWGQLAADGKARGAFPQELVEGTVEMIRGRWPEVAAVRWVTCVPSRRHPDLVPDFARRLAAALALPFSPDVHKTRETQPQKEMENRYHQCNNLDGAFEVRARCERFKEPVLLVDDVTDSGWTLSIVAALLRQAGSGPVFPLALASASGD